MENRLLMKSRELPETSVKAVKDFKRLVCPFQKNTRNSHTVHDCGFHSAIPDAPGNIIPDGMTWSSRH